MHTKIPSLILIVFTGFGLASCTKRQANEPSPFLREHLGEH